MKKLLYNLNSNLFNKSFIFKVIKHPWSFKFLKDNGDVLILEVFLNSNKIMIKKSVEIFFGIKVLKINTSINKYSIYKNNHLIKFVKQKKAYIKFIN